MVDRAGVVNARVAADRANAIATRAVAFFCSVMRHFLVVENIMYLNGISFCLYYGMKILVRL